MTGASGCGKSYLLLQAVNYCAANDWIVLYVPRAIQWVNSSTPYSYDTRSQTFHQPALASTILEQFTKFNEGFLTSLKTHAEHVFDKNKKAELGTSLDQLAALGVKDASIAPRVLEALFNELGQQKKHPVLLAVDEFQALYSRTMYRDPKYNLLHPYHLSMPRLILEYTSGMKSFARGAVIGALSSTNTSFTTPLELQEVLGISPAVSETLYAKRSPSLMAYTKGLRAIAIPERFSVDEAASLFEVWAQNKALHTASGDSFFLSKYAETSGNPREFVSRGLLSTLAS
jgi:small subunit ribosomal protein S29